MAMTVEERERLTPRPAPSAAGALEEFLYLGEEPLAFGVVLLALLCLGLELLQQLALPASQVLRRLHRDLDEQVPARGAAQHRESLAAQAELIAGLRAGRHLHLGLAAVDRRYLDLPTERRQRHAHRHAQEN